MSIPDFAARPQLAEDVARLIRRRIFDGTYPAGNYIRLEQLAAELGISVTPVREALFGLRTEGLLKQQPRRGFLVLPVTRRDIDDVAGVQAHIGGQLASRAAGQITDGQLDDLDRIQRELEVAYTDNDHEAAVRLNHAFHRGVNRAAESPKLAQLMSQITRYALESVYPTVEGWPEQSTHDHRRILAALKARDGDAARDAMAEHLCAASRPLSDHLDRLGVLE
ncbi:GntR family transcriptional regulator [Mycolicibacterium peregrinum]|uniref:GntR family transcriptional regulator n=1 Tax=Mycolicibacterium peregrinum TaxID=43304 RepID=A0A1A0VP26_MYCPR|nr:GntR family transcriptional regulator [Mycolicibacterium peregrinum]OBB84973.1 GntR family transcriptional regulator [Mycolicibacterium peregrinum]OBF43835.1 GntR family transcriptional regulator [Mycolicibacterium peregrinum]